MGLAYYRFFPGDYQRDTRHLSMMQNGAYRLLIDEYMIHGPLPNDLQRLYRICSAFSKEEMSAVEYVLTEFFRLNGPAWNHKRCDVEREWQQKKSKAGKDGADTRWQNNEDANAMPTHMPTQSERNANQNQNQNQNTEPKPRRSKAIARSAVALQADAPLSEYRIPLNDATEFAVPLPLVTEWESLFPDVDIPNTLRQIRAWNLANPTRRKTKTGIVKHITNWLAKEQNA